MPTFYFMGPERRFTTLEEPKYILPPESRDYIHFDDVIATPNVYDAYAQSGEEVLPLLRQWRAKYDFHVLTFRCLLHRSSGARGVKRFTLDAKITGGKGGSVQVHDVGPKTQWVEGSKGLDIEVGLDLDMIKSLLTFAQLPIPVQGKVAFRYRWRPMIAKIISGCAGRDMYWEFRAISGQYLEGELDLTAIVRRSRQVRHLSLELLDARAHHDVWLEDRVYVNPRNLVPVEFNEDVSLLPWTGAGPSFLSHWDHILLLILLKSTS